MAKITITDEAHRRLKLAATLAGRTLTDFVDEICSPASGNRENAEAHIVAALQVAPPPFPAAR